MPTRRQPLQREVTRGQITPRCLEAFAKLRGLKPGTDAWRKHRRVIREELRLEPWQWPGIERPDSADDETLSQGELEDRERWRELEAALERSRMANGG